MQKLRFVTYILKKPSFLADFLTILSLKFKKLKNHITRKTLGWTAILDMIAGTGGIKTDNLFSEIKKLEGEKCLLDWI